jgi:hypothetical protein
VTDRLISVVDDDPLVVPLPPGTFKPGVIFSMRRILRFAVVLLGLQLSFAQLVKFGTVGLAIIAVTVAATFVFTMRLGRWLGIDRKLTQLIASGTSISGASAVIAANTVTRASDEDVTYAVRRNPETAELDVRRRFGHGIHSRQFYIRFSHAFTVFRMPMSGSGAKSWRELRCLHQGTYSWLQSISAAWSMPKTAR